MKTGLLVWSYELQDLGFTTRFDRWLAALSIVGVGGLIVWTAGLIHGLHMLSFYWIERLTPVFMTVPFVVSGYGMYAFIGFLKRTRPVYAWLVRPDFPQGSCKPRSCRGLFYSK